MRVIFHAPFPLAPDARAASGIRPVKMCESLEELGHEVWRVDGYAAERAAGMRRVRQAINDGVRFDACYSELSTMPTPLTDPDHLPRHPLMDYEFFRQLRRVGTPVGVFYRDIAWKFPGYGANLSALRRQVALGFYRFEVAALRRQVALGFYRFEVAALRRSIDVLFLPSLPMAPYVGGGFTCRALPPAHAMTTPHPAPAGVLSLIYVGGMGDRYRLQTLVETVNRARNEGVDVRLTLCCHADQWDAVKDSYAPLGPAIRVIEASGAALHQEFQTANVGALFVEPLEYWTFAAPMKLYEYLGEGTPIIATSRTLAGDFVAENGCGWTVPYEVDAGVALLRRLADHPEEVDAARERVMAVRESHTWRARAQQMLDDLTSVRNR